MSSKIFYPTNSYQYQQFFNQLTSGYFHVSSNVNEVIKTILDLFLNGPKKLVFFYWCSGTIIPLLLAVLFVHVKSFCKKKKLKQFKTALIISFTGHQDNFRLLYSKIIQTLKRK